MNRPYGDEEQPSVYRNPSNLEWIAILLLSSPLFFFFDSYEDQPFRGFIAALSLALVLSMILLLWPLRRKVAFWACLAGIALAHIMLVYFLPYTGEFRFGFAAFPIAVMDAYLCARLIIFACGARLENPG